MPSQYRTLNIEGGLDRAAKGKWRVEGPGLNPPLHFDDRTRAKVVERALQQAYDAGKAALAAMF